MWRLGSWGGGWRRAACARRAGRHLTLNRSSSRCGSPIQRSPGRPGRQLLSAPVPASHRNRTGIPRRGRLPRQEGTSCPRSRVLWACRPPATGSGERWRPCRCSTSGTDSSRRLQRRGPGSRHGRCPFFSKVTLSDSHTTGVGVITGVESPHPTPAQTRMSKPRLMTRIAPRYTSCREKVVSGMVAGGVWRASEVGNSVPGLS